MSDLPLYLILPAIAAVVYAAAAFFFKEAFRGGAGTLHTFVVTSWVMALFFGPFIFWEKGEMQWHLVKQ